MYSSGEAYKKLFQPVKILNKTYSNLLNCEIIHTKDGTAGKIKNIDSKYVTVILDGKERIFTHKIFDNITFTKINKSIEDEIKFANLEIENKAIYINEFVYECWKEKYKKIYNFIKNTNEEIFKLSNDEVVYELIKEFKGKFTSSSFIEKHNQEYIENEKNRYKYLFDNIGGISLDNVQREVIIKDEINHMIIAGAGCGKTTLICGKIKYLLEKYSLLPSDILVLSFSNKTVTDLKLRLNKDNSTKDIQVSTIHKLGKNIIKAVEGKDIANIDDKEIRNRIKDIFEDLIEQDEDFQNMVTDFYINYKYPVYENDNIQKTYEEYLRKNNKIITINGEVVRSYEELLISNFLFKNGIDYKYEARYKYDNLYKPDFYLPKYDIYIEHYGLDENNNTSKKIKNPEKYKQQIYLKRQKHNMNHTRLIETYSHMNKNRGLQSYLNKSLKRYGVEFKTINKQAILDRIRKTIHHDSLLELIVKVILLAKGDEKIFDYILNSKVTNNSLSWYRLDYISCRENIFIQMIEKIYTKYNSRLEKEHNIDFSDMITKATQYINEEKYNSKFKYIIVDEYQDISNSMNDLIKAISKDNKCRLLCVGDDWQSIYRFRGSNSKIINNFKAENKYSEISYITNTYRFDANLVDISNRFILNDKRNLKKQIVSKRKGFMEQCQIVRSITKALDLINSKEKNNSTSIFLIGRYNEDLDKIKEDNRYKYDLTFDNENNIIYKNNKNLNIKFLTTHSAKGLEADYVIIVNCEKSNLDNNLMGFPSDVENDPILDKLLDIGEGNTDNKKLSREKNEERRLFYVALTRAKKQVYLNLPINKEASCYMYELRDILNNKRRLTYEHARNSK